MSDSVPSKERVTDSELALLIEFAKTFNLGALLSPLYELAEIRTARASNEPPDDLVDAAEAWAQANIKNAQSYSTTVTRARAQEAYIAGATRASQPPGDAELKDWRFVAQTLEECQNRLQAKDGGARHSWMDPALDIARGRAGSVPTKEVR